MSLKWKNRSARLIKEIQNSRADIICLQEVDTDKALTFWKVELEKIGYETRFLTKKSNGVMMGFLKDK